MGAMGIAARAGAQSPGALIVRKSVFGEEITPVALDFDLVGASRGVGHYGNTKTLSAPPRRSFSAREGRGGVK